MSKIEFTYIYTLTDPFTNEIRYVGKADNLLVRLKEHIKRSSYTVTHKNNWIQSLLKKNAKPIIEVLDIVPINDWGFWEIYWISVIKSWGFKLTNLASGGKGGNQGPIINKKISESLKNRTYSPETIEKMRIARIGMVASEETKKKFSIMRTGSGNSMFGKKRPESSKKYRAILQLDLSGNVIREWVGIAAASRELNINRTSISGVCNGRRKMAGGYAWRHVN
jgi:group I intron endonuclease